MRVIQLYLYLFYNRLVSDLLLIHSELVNYNRGIYCLYRSFSPPPNRFPPASINAGAIKKIKPLSNKHAIFTESSKVHYYLVFCIHYFPSPYMCRLLLLDRKSIFSTYPRSNTHKSKNRAISLLFSQAIH